MPRATPAAPSRAANGTSGDRGDQGTTETTVRIFISSPGDVAEERLLARRVVERLKGEFASRATLQPVFWEHEPLRATTSWQEQILPPSEADVVICILWSRLGTRQPPELTRPDGRRYDSGTEYEFEEAWRSFRTRGQPDLLVYRKTRDPRVSLRDKTELMERLEQKEALDRFMNTWFHDREEGTLLAAFHPFESSDDFEELFEVHLRKLLEQRLPRGRTGAEPRVKSWTAGSPFRGLKSFEFDHSPVFFGRTRATSEVLDALRVQAAEGRPFVLVLGMSGCGKSSLVRAGVLPLLTQPGVIEGVGLWRWAVLRPGDAGADPFIAMATALLCEEALPELGADGTGVEELAKLLRESPEAAFPLLKGGLSQAAAELAREEGLAQQPEARLALVVDQLEELFTSPMPVEDRHRFTDALLALVKSGKVWVLGTLRSDFYPHSTDLPSLVELKEGNGQYDLLPPTAAEIGQMIRQPAQLAGLDFEEDSSTGERLDDTLRDAAARNPEALPLLEFTLEELYSARSSEDLLTFAAYDELGGVAGALAQRAEAVFGSLQPEEQLALPLALSRLVTIGADAGDGATRQRTDLEAFPQGKPERKLIERFVEARLCVTDRDESGKAVVSVAHEALLEHWPRLAEWLGHNRDLLRMRDRLDAAAEQWEAEGRPDSYLLASAQRLAEAEELERAQEIDLPAREHAFLQASLARGRRTRWLKRVAVLALAILALLAATGAWLADNKRREAEVARGESEAVTSFLGDMLASVNPRELGREVLVRDVLDEASKKIDELGDQPLIQARLMHTMGNVYFSLGLYEEAQPLLEDSLALREESLGPNDPLVAEALNDSANLLRKTGDYEEARSRYERALGIREETLGPESLETAESLVGVGVAYFSMNEFQQARPLLERALQIRERALGASDPVVASSLNNLGLALEFSGDYEGARPLYERALGIVEQARGPGHVDVATALTNLGIVLMELGAYEAAKPLLERALEINEQALGPNHFDVSSSIGFLGNLMDHMGEYEASRQLFERAVEIQRKAVGPDHPSLATNLGNLAIAMEHTGDLEEALELHEEVLALKQRILGPEHRDVADTLNNIALVHHQLGNLEEAESLLRRALEIQLRELAENHPALAYTQHNLAGVLHDGGQVEESESLFLSALENREEKLGSDHPHVADTLEGYAALLRDLDRGAEATELKTRAQAIRSRDS